MDTMTWLTLDPTFEFELKQMLSICFDYLTLTLFEFELN